jgi:hypothetical protein
MGAGGSREFGFTDMRFFDILIRFKIAHARFR